MRALSHSQITLYLQCPLKYKFRYKDGLKEKPRSYLSFGKSVHEALEFLFGSKFKTPPSLEEVLEKYTKVWIREGYKDEKEENQYFEYGKNIIKEFYKKHTDPYKPPIAAEHNIRFEVEGVKVVAVMDRIDKLDDNSVEIIDYKTNKNPFSLPELAKEPQLTMYQYAIEQDMGLRVDKLTYYHLPSQTPFTVPRHGDEEINALKKRIVKIAENIKSNIFPYKKNDFCPCDFSHLCPLYIHEHKKDVEGDKGAINISKIADEYGVLKDSEKELKAKIDVLQTEVKVYMNKEDLAKVSGDRYEVTKSKTKQERLDSRKAKEVLKSNNLLDGLIQFKDVETIRCKQKKV